MSACTHATFDAGFPEDAQWDVNGTPLKPAGEGVTSAIRAGLLNRGIRCTDILQRSFYGWEFDCDVDGRSFICVVQAYEGDKWLLICEPRRSLWQELFSRNDDQELGAASTTMHEVLTSDSRFSNVRWHHREKKGDIVLYRKCRISPFSFCMPTTLPTS